MRRLATARRGHFAIAARWSRMGVFATIMTELAAQVRQTKTAMIDATDLAAHRTASSLAVKKAGTVRPGTADPAHERWAELETARPGRCQGPLDPDVSVCGPDLGYYRGKRVAVLVFGRPGRCWHIEPARQYRFKLACAGRLVPQRSDQDGHFSVHRGLHRPQGPNPARC